MVNAQLLDERIHDSGIKKNFIIEKLGISPQAFWKKQNNKGRFRVAEIYVICNILNLSEDDRRNIFFANELT